MRATLTVYYRHNVARILVERRERRRKTASMRSPPTNARARSAAAAIVIAGAPSRIAKRAAGQLQGYGLWLTGCRSPVAKRS